MRSFFGKILALGSRGAAEKLGKGAEYLMTVNGIELPMHDPKWAPGFARSYRSDPTPGRHVKGGRGGRQIFNAENKYNYENTGLEDLQLVAFSELLNAAGLCLFSYHVGILTIVQDFMEAVTGRTLSAEEQLNTAMRMVNMRHAFNLREGQKPSALSLPPRSVGEPPQQEGPLKGITIDYQKLHQNFCQAIQWDEDTLMPSRESLEALGGLEDVINDLWK
jgi:aldehyde:ferredoxin oxidoreductase